MIWTTWTENGSGLVIINFCSLTPIESNSHVLKFSKIVKFTRNQKVRED